MYLPVISFNGIEVELVISYQYLGIILASQLKFDKHVDYLKRKLNTKMRCLGRIRQYIPEELALQLYSSLILPHLDYGDIIYDAMSTTLSNQLQVVQNNCLRICLKRDRMTHVPELHTDSKVNKLDDRRNRLPSELTTCSPKYLRHILDKPGTVPITP